MEIFKDFRYRTEENTTSSGKPVFKSKHERLGDELKKRGFNLTHGKGKRKKNKRKKK